MAVFLIREVAHHAYYATAPAGTWPPRLSRRHHIPYEIDTEIDGSVRRCNEESYASALSANHGFKSYFKPFMEEATSGRHI